MLTKMTCSWWSNTKILITVTLPPTHYYQFWKFSKRNDIEARLLELQAEIELRKAYSAMPAGHGRFNFDDM